MEKQNIKVIGIDPAPGKGSTYFDGVKITPQAEFKDLDKYLNELKENVLICWDAPLTVPLDDENISLTDRPIEKFLREKISKKKVEGVSVLHYSSCQHWTISQHLLGLPIMGKYCNANIPFKLIWNEHEKNNISKSIVEVHPTVAIYFWLGDDFKPYKGKKGNKSNLNENWGKLKKIKCIKNVLPNIADIECKNDDGLDSIIAYVLGKLWVEGSEEVALLGNEKTGSMLMPKNKELFDTFENWVAKQK